MNRRRLVLLSLFFLAIFLISKYRKEETFIPEEDFQTPVATTVIEHKETPEARGVEPLPKAPAIRKEDSKMTALFKKAGLSREKIKAVYDLGEFHGSSPELNEENARRRNEYLSELNKDPAGTLNSFKKVISQLGPKEDAMRSFLLNMTAFVNASDDEKADVFTERIKSGARFTKDGAVHDNELSIVIALSRLTRLTDDEAKLKALDEIKSNLKEDDRQMQRLLIDYFPEHAQEIRNP